MGDGWMAWAEKVRSCVDWSEGDRARLQEVRGWLDADRERMIEDLGEQVVEFNGAQALKTNARFMRRLHGLLREWLEGLLGGTFDGPSVRGREALGRELAHVDLTFEDVILLEGMTRERLYAVARERLEGQPDRLSAIMDTLNKAFTRDLALIYAGYVDLHNAELERALLDRFLTITGFSPTLYDSLAEAARWRDAEG
ncbi:MAG: protoglobin domain-containing protein [Chloroflexota bacterium]|nr:protoglobin domain-containing protein [Chloroflexota bacterium]